MTEELFPFRTKASAKAHEAAGDHVRFAEQVVNLARIEDRGDPGIGADVGDILGHGAPDGGNDIL